MGRKHIASVPSVLGLEPTKLKKQERYGQKPWQPGEIPTRSGSLMPIHGRLDMPSAPHREFLEVRKPENLGLGYPLKMDVEGSETKGTAARGGKR